MSRAHDPRSLCVLVRAGPGTQSHHRDHYFALWSLLYPGDVYDVRVIRDTGKLNQLHSQHQKALSGLRYLEKKRANAAEEEVFVRTSLALEEDTRASEVELEIEMGTTAADSTSSGAMHESAHDIDDSVSVMRRRLERKYSSITNTNASEAKKTTLYL